MFEKFFGPSEDSPKEKNEKDMTCPACGTPLHQVGPCKEGSNFNAYQCLNGHEVVQ